MLNERNINKIDAIPLKSSHIGSCVPIRRLLCTQGLSAVHTSLGHQHLCPRPGMTRKGLLLLLQASGIRPLDLPTLQEWHRSNSFGQYVFFAESYVLFLNLCTCSSAVSPIGREEEAGGGDTRRILQCQARSKDNTK